MTDFKFNPKTASTDSLCFVGDAVYSLLVREMLIANHDGESHSNELHKASVLAVNAAAQARAYKIIEPILSDDEKAVYKRGRNSHNNHKPRNAQTADYCSATGLEALFGYLYLSKSEQRIYELFDKIRSECLNDI